MPDNTIDLIQSRIIGAVDAYGHETEAETPDAKLRDMLGDLRHYADAYGLDFGKEDRAAHQVYLEELGQ